MWLLHAQDLKLVQFHDSEVPPYAILSHTWGDGEVTFHDVNLGFNATRDKKGWEKVEKCTTQAVNCCLEYIWIDTCCIDKSSSAELQEAINSMFQWYAEASECFVFLADYHRGSNDSAHPGPSMHQSRWFKRGWTLQELLAPSSVRFFSSDWVELGDKVTMRMVISSITGISQKVLLDSVIDARSTLDSVSVAERMSWAAGRETTRVEDISYCLLGIFDINMPLIYGEGSKSFKRLQQEIMGKMDDQSILAWGLGQDSLSLWGMSTALAQSPADFSDCRDLISWGSFSLKNSFGITPRGLQLTMPVVAAASPNDDLLYCLINCSSTAHTAHHYQDRILAEPVIRRVKAEKAARRTVDQYYWLSSRIPLWVKPDLIETAVTRTIDLPLMFDHGRGGRNRVNLAVNFHASPPNGYFIAGIFPPEVSRNQLIEISLPGTSPGVFCAIIHLASYTTNGIFLILRGKKKIAPPKQHDGENHPHSAGVSTSQLAKFDAPNVTLPGTRRLVCRSIASHLGMKYSEVTEDSKLGDLGIDSISSVWLARMLSEKLGVKFSVRLFFESSTVGDIIKKLHSMALAYSRLQNHPHTSGRAGSSAIAGDETENQLVLENVELGVLKASQNASILQFLDSSLLEEVLFTTPAEDGRARLAVEGGSDLDAVLKRDGIKHDLSLRFHETCSAANIP